MPKLNIKKYEQENPELVQEIVKLRKEDYDTAIEKSELKNDRNWLTGIIIGTFTIYPGLGSIVGWVIGRNIESDALTKVRRFAEYQGAEAALKAAKGAKDSLPQEYLAALAGKEAASKRTYQLGAKRFGHEVTIMSLIAGLPGAVLGFLGSTIRTALHERWGRQAGEKAEAAYNSKDNLEEKYKENVNEKASEKKDISTRERSESSVSVSSNEEKIIRAKPSRKKKKNHS